MASKTSEQTTNRQGTAEPVEEQADSVGQNGGNQSEALAAAKRAAGTAVAAALAGALVGAGKALLDRRANSDGSDTAKGEDSDEAVETEAASAPSVDDDRGESADRPEFESDEAPVETSGRGEGYEEEDDEEEEEEDVHADPAARHDETDPDETDDDQPEDGTDERDRPQSGASSSNVSKIIERARNHARDLLGEEPESVTGIDRSNGSWTVTLEVVELHRVPDTTDVMGAYQLVLDDEGNLVRFDRTARYVRSQVEDVS